ncbi:phosphoglycerate kinase [Diaphorobacter sp. HDW4B]|uniref:histidine phosphatase family protein n=1 Tax=Diaphorobacter sp. HDW4B TaxID=2714925 RepID=UPI001409A8A8|nr:histidine phosphatase family protein [Diaphorobacter sp. HDW4B]QIL70121.1 phosphoglycerate kinase [Diaphorobacter sp. HDW4B]
MSQAPRLWLVRHARPLIETGVCYGQLDVAADEDHTKASAHQLHATLPREIQTIHCSPLQRCQQLAHALLSARSGTARTDARLQEMDFGTWEGQRWDAIARAELDAWTDNFTAYQPGNGESLQTMLTRVKEVLHDARQQEKDVVWITHAGVIRCVIWLLEHGDRKPQASEWTMAAPGFGEWFPLPLTPP